MSADNFVSSSDECSANAKASLFLVSGNGYQQRSDGCSNGSGSLHGLGLRTITNFVAPLPLASLPMSFCFNQRATTTGTLFKNFGEEANLCLSPLAADILAQERCYSQAFSDSSFCDQNQTIVFGDSFDFNR
jgi:hypothetical protein